MLSSLVLRALVGVAMRISSIVLSIGLFFVSAAVIEAQILPPPDPKAEEITAGNPGLAPFKWAGMLVVNLSNNEIGTCTGQFIAPNVVLTAGHCVRNIAENPAGPWPDLTRAATFWLQYQNRSGIPFKILCAETNPLWSLPANYAQLSAADQNVALNKAFEHDYAMLLVDGTSPTGFMRYETDWKGKYTHAARIGYPADILDATVIQKAPGIIFSSDAIPMAGSPNIIGQWGPVADATEGMSGGAWVVHPDAREGKGNNVLIAVSSFVAVGKKGKVIYPGGSFAAYLKAVEFNPLLISVLNNCR